MAELSATDLAVVIPTRDRWDILEMTLTGLSRQTVSAFETIVVVDGTDQDVPPLGAGQVIVKRRAGPAAARNAGARATERSVVMFIGDDTIPAPDLVERHLGTHRRHPEREAAAVGFVGWHDSVAGNPINSWLEWSGTQSWYSSLSTEGEQEVSHWHFYTSNISVKRDFLLDSGGFDEDFPFAAFEDIECGLRLSRLGLQLYYEPRAVCHHLHDYDWAALERRFTTMAVSERLMVDMHPEVDPGCLNRMKEATARPGLPLGRFVDSFPARFKRLDQLVRGQANRHFHRRLSPTYMEAWGRGAELCELRRYLGDRFDSARLVYGTAHRDTPTDPEVAPSGLRHDEDQLFDLAQAELSGRTSRVHTVLLSHLPPHSEVLDYGCGIGSEGLRLAEGGHAVHFADHPGPALAYLEWRLHQRRLAQPVHEIGAGPLPETFDLAFCTDASRPGHDPLEVLRRLQEVAEVAAVVVRPEVAGHLDAAGNGNAPAGGAELVARDVLPDGSVLLVYRRQQVPVGSS